jgi:hypothetical protein
MRRTGVGSLLISRPGGVAVLCDADQDWEQFRVAILGQMSPRARCRIGVCAPCAQPTGQGAQDEQRSKPESTESLVTKIIGTLPRK